MQNKLYKLYIINQRNAHFLKNILIFNILVLN